ncbi:Hypothetical predicted protein [Mytilus galloprovincialis]|uniref:C2H2-type domain-containing protein n=1 Tax=Mytilus galloprovincialis TaxID=29158 RepID=A0A8B6DL38_MYTGA|nr:Hypothetical predicted protein [Mytilus galloprovincialis]
MQPAGNYYVLRKAHRDLLGTSWKTNSSKCAYPVHSTKCKGDRAIDFKTSKELFFLYQSLIPVGSGICKPCRTSHPHVISTRSQMYRTTSCGDDTESIELANLAYFFPTQSTATLISSHEEWEPEMSCLEKVNAVIKLVSDGSFPLLRYWKCQKLLEKERERNETGDAEDNIEEINEQNTEENAASHDQMNETDDYTCGECGLTFVSLHEYNIHQDIGNHNIRHADRVKTFWSSKCTNIKESMTSVFSKATDDQTPQTKTQCSLHSGWSLKGRRMNKRFSIAVKDYLLNLFMEGEQTGRKYTPTEASKKIRAVRDENGNRLFSPEEWLSSQQVQGLFSRFVNQSGKIPKEESDDELNDAIIEITRQENELELIHSICQ